MQLRIFSLFFLCWDKYFYANFTMHWKTLKNTEDNNTKLSDQVSSFRVCFFLLGWNCVNLNDGFLMKWYFWKPKHIHSGHQTSIHYRHLLWSLRRPFASILITNSILFQNGWRFWLSYAFKCPDFSDRPFIIAGLFLDFVWFLLSCTTVYKSMILTVNIKWFFLFCFCFLLENS